MPNVRLANRLRHYRQLRELRHPAAVVVVYRNDWRGPSPEQVIPDGAEVIGVTYVDDWRGSEHPMQQWPTMEVPLDDQTPADRYAAGCAEMAEHERLQEPSGRAGEGEGILDALGVRAQPERWVVLRMPAAEAKDFVDRATFFHGLGSRQGEFIREIASEMVRLHSPDGLDILGAYDTEEAALAAAQDALMGMLLRAADNDR